MAASFKLLGTPTIYDGAMFNCRSLSRLFLFLFRRPRNVEASRLIIGSTGSGKSEGELVELVRLADRRDHAVVLLDGHGPLAFNTAGHWFARGHAERLIYEPLRATDRVLCWDMLPRSGASSLSDRRLEDAETRDEVAQCFLAQRNLASLVDRPATKEWLDAAITLCLSQPEPEPLPSLLSAFRVGSSEYERLLLHSDNAPVVAKFREVERVWRRNPVQYEVQTGASRRLLELVCDSEVVRLRSRPGLFDWLGALQTKNLIAVDGGGIRSREIRRTLFLLMSLQVIQAIRRHFSRTQRPLPVVLVLEEAGALGLVTPFILSALQELRKAGLALHIITQSSLDFGDPAVFHSVLANTPWQAWYQVLSPADQELGAKVFTNTTFDPLALHFTRTRQLHDGLQSIPTQSHGESRDLHTGTRRLDRRTGMAHVPAYRPVTDAYFKTPQIQEQEYRTTLATLPVGTRLVRDRRGIRRERVPMLRRLRLTDEEIRARIECLRQQPPFQPGTPPPPSPPRIHQGAAALLRRRRKGQLSPPL